MNLETAERVAVEALGFIAEQEERVTSFLAKSGLETGDLRTAAAEPGFLAGVLAHLLGDEGLLLEFSGWSGRAPDEAGAAYRCLAGPGVPEWT